MKSHTLNILLFVSNALLVLFIILSSYNKPFDNNDADSPAAAPAQENLVNEVVANKTISVSQEIDRLNNIMMVDAVENDNISLVSTIVDLRQENALLKSQVSMFREISKIGQLSKIESMYADNTRLRLYDAIILRSILMHFVNHLNNEKSINLAFNIISDLNNKIKSSGIDPTDAKYIISINEISSFKIPEDLEIEVNDTK